MATRTRLARLTGPLAPLVLVGALAACGPEPATPASGDTDTAGPAATESPTADEPTDGQAGPQDVEKWASEQAAEQWLRRVPQDPGGLLRRKFLYQYQRAGVDQAGNRVEAPGTERRPW